jgi:hypothetical protein
MRTRKSTVNNADAARAVLICISSHEKPGIDKWVRAHRNLPARMEMLAEAGQPDVTIRVTSG